VLDHEVPPQAVTLARRKTLRVVLVLLVIGALASPVIYYGIRRAALRSAAQDELDRLPVPSTWVPQSLGDRYEGPMFGRTSYASITRTYLDVPDDPGAVVSAGSRLAGQAGWGAANGYEADSPAPSCRPYYDGCWSKNEYRLFLDVSRHAAAETSDPAQCPSPPNAFCTSLKFMIVYVP
jgi:hypothetical protein